MGRLIAKYLFGSFGKVVSWIIFFIVVSLVPAPYGWIVLLIFFLVGPGIAIPAIFAAYGKHVVSTRGVRELQQMIDSCFLEKRWSKTSGIGDLNYELDATFLDMAIAHGQGPTVSVDFEKGQDMTVVHIWMSHSISGGLNRGKGTPFYTLGASRANKSIKKAAALIDENISHSDAYDNVGTTSEQDALSPASVVTPNNAADLTATSCPSCGKAIKSGMKFCRHCGASLQGPIN